MCGIFAYLNHLTPKTRKEILDLLIKVCILEQFVSIITQSQGLQRLEYRGYDSAGVSSKLRVPSAKTSPGRHRQRLAGGGHQAHQEHGQGQYRQSLWTLINSYSSAGGASPG